MPCESIYSRDYRKIQKKSTRNRVGCLTLIFVYGASDYVDSMQAVVFELVVQEIIHHAVSLYGHLKGEISTSCRQHTLPLK